MQNANAVVFNNVVYSAATNFEVEFMCAQSTCAKKATLSKLKRIVKECVDYCTVQFEIDYSNNSVKIYSLDNESDTYCSLFEVFENELQNDFAQIYDNTTQRMFYVMFNVGMRKQLAA